MTKPDYYSILGISKNAEEREIKRAYKRLAIKFHPDRNPGNIHAESKFKEIKEAYEILINPQKRAAYDQYGHAAFDQSQQDFSSSSAEDFSEIFGDVFGDIFGSSKRKKSRGRDIVFSIEISLEEAVKGTKKKISVSSREKCDSCYGTGASRDTNSIMNCSTCHGTGQIQMRQGFFSVQQTCPYCRGEGKIIKNPCRKCYGYGNIKINKEISIRIPSGVDNGDKIRIPGKGEISYDNSENGDLYVKIHVKKHPIFAREGNNLYCEVPINFSLAALGGEIEVPTLNGRLKLKIPSETQTNRLFRIRGKGVRSVHGGRKGDLLCRVIVETPVRLSEKQKYLLKELKKSFLSPSGHKNSPKSNSFFDGVKRFFDELTR
ncbi:molecular chaperone DnaJ [bacterium endosymbiont of Pedicinus badii]|uniref:molecular chaperone DnaJ n=1 Tax=bacterium endosymbiont of Pedicinus badii TaxID=1719126 RepID=UPI0009BA3AAA|nr:molecular chaperone DnaJ [bacterium endosymbiont of Pedicinus badii]OQM34198.1 molecular chaperone DnaJ [bacterium endosymbiont of Pedicinus badii]